MLVDFHGGRCAIPAGYVSVVNLLLERGVDPSPSSRGGSAVDLATELSTIKDNEAMVRLLFRFGFDLKLDTHGPCSESYLVQAAKYNLPNTVEALLEHGAGANKRNICKQLLFVAINSRAKCF